MRAVTAVEREILYRLLTVDFPGAEALRIQAGTIREVEPNCTCGCPSLTPHVDRTAAPSARSSSPLPVELAEMDRPGGILRTVLCFLDEQGYMSNLECVYYDDPLPEWPAPKDCAVLFRDDERYLTAVSLPGGATVRPHEAGDRWMSFEEGQDGGFCASTWSGFRECFGRDGTEISRVFTK